MSTAAPAPVAMLPFNAAAREHTEVAFDVSLTPGTTTQEVLQGANQSLPAEGFLRSVYLEVTSSGGTGGTYTAGGDAPWNFIQSVTLSDVNGAPIFGPVTGYQLYLINKYGGYMFRADPAAAPDYSASTNAPAFFLRIPIEVNRQSGFGSLGNQNAAAAYKLRITLNTLANVYSANPSPVPALRFRGFIETWTQPLPQDAAGRPQQTQPPAHGTTQYWTAQQFTINGGQQIVQFTRVGNLIRSFIAVYRAATGLRVTFASGNMPDPIEVDWDARMFFQETLRYRRGIMVQTFAAQAAATNGATQVDDGVLSYNFDRSILGHTGGGSTAMYLPTVQSTRLQFNNVFPVAGVLEILTNDIAPVEVNPNMRYAEGSATGFHPQVGTPIAGAGA